MNRNYYGLSKKELAKIDRQIQKILNSKYRYNYSYLGTLKLIIVVIGLYVILFLIS